MWLITIFIWKLWGKVTSLQSCERNKCFNIMKIVQLYLCEFIVLYEYFIVLYKIIYNVKWHNNPYLVCLLCLFHRSAHIVWSCGDFNWSTNRFGSKCDDKLWSWWCKRGDMAVAESTRSSGCDITLLLKPTNRILLQKYLQAEIFSEICTSSVHK